MTEFSISLDKDIYTLLERKKQEKFIIVVYMKFKIKDGWIYVFCILYFFTYKIKFDIS